MKTPETNKPTGNLEELFRHHLTEASVPPRPQVWEQIDTSLLLAQNETYRRRLRGARWLAAASLLLATLAGTGWWAQRDFTPGPGSAATIRGAAQPAWEAGRATGANRATAQAERKAHQPGSKNGSQPLHSPAIASSPTSTSPASASSSTSTTPVTASQLAAKAMSSKSGRPVPTGSTPPRRPIVEPTLAAASSARRRTGIAGTAAALAGSRARISLPEKNNSAGREYKNSASETSSLLAAGPGTPPGSSRSARSAPAMAILARHTGGRKPGAATAAGRLGAKELQPRQALVPRTAAMESSAQLAAAAAPAPVVPLSGLAAGILPLPVAALPSSLAGQPLLAAELPTPAAPRNWHLGFTYAVSAFQSNINFSRAGLDSPYGYRTSLGANSASLSELAAAEHKARQRPGLGQRLRLQASRRLRGKWSLATGFELAQQESHSSTSYRFMGDQVPDFSQMADRTTRRRETHARYQLVGLPLEVSYADPLRTGFSFYGRAGAVASVLLTSHAELEGSPEATRTYDLLSATTPYRRLLGSLRGAVGVQLRPVGHDYTLRLGPVVEGGIWSMNAHPAQDFVGQSRPYSFGVEAGVEFGRAAKKL